MCQYRPFIDNVSGKEVFYTIGLCATATKCQGITYGSCGKVSVERDGIHATGFILDEICKKWKVKLCNSEIIYVDKVLFRDGGYVYSENRRRSRCRWIITHYWPVRIKIQTGCLNNTQFMMNRLACKGNDIIIQLSS